MTSPQQSDFVQGVDNFSVANLQDVQSPVKKRIIGKQTIGATPLDLLSWTCNVRGKVLRGPSKNNLSKRRWIHIDYYHKGKRAEVSRIRERPVIVVASDSIPTQERIWNCGTCGHGLPQCSKHVTSFHSGPSQVLLWPQWKEKF